MTVRALRTFHTINPETGARVKISRGEEVPGWADITNPKIVGGGRSADAEPETPQVETEQPTPEVETPEVEPETEPTPANTEQDTKTLDDMGVKDLRKLAKDNDVELTGAKVKADIVEALASAGVFG